jgi:hypothetical protein
MMYITNILRGCVFKNVSHCTQPGIVSIQSQSNDLQCFQRSGIKLQTLKGLQFEMISGQSKELKVCQDIKRSPDRHFISDKQ